ncbi:DUF7521 family protein [Halalkalicoccus jeotgali]|uniref:Uncharacterized protein n=1 Tax=Halalkalicoccus jeotgali (strain DSM 18796 / CECT 7217 / JCM 14584 / KCTC 4019 / B3) TaxID=795797 RepID=D8JA27_HALJB|nr:hypothetical protein [Halalkalicoccus jeotgali]ADJ14549.1 hypothetical protein HacjB3_05790 [Halalkalicoccus jeotgali B3]ELY39922.1 hypothetical protein C497_04157 [Halalkalicoccus jeotgali B3]
MVHETAPEWVTIALIVVKTLMVVLGGAITFFAYRAFRRTRNRSLGLLTGGFALVTLGSALAGLAFEILGVWIGLGVLIEGLFVLAGFSLIAASLLGE